MVLLHEMEKYPIIIGDTTAGSNELDGSVGFANVNFNVPCLYNMVQKIYIISSNIVVAVAGDYLRNKCFIQAIKAFFECHTATKSNLELFINNNLQTEFENDSYAICFVDPQTLNIEYRYFGKWNAKEIENLGKVTFADFESHDYLEQIKKEVSKSFSKTETYQDAIKNSLLIISKTIGDKCCLADDIQKVCGSAFEIIVFDYENKSFVKLDDITYMVWKCSYKPASESLICMPSFHMTNKYVNEILSISCPTNDSKRLFVACPIDINEDGWRQSSNKIKLTVRSKLIFNIFQIDIVGINENLVICDYSESKDVSKYNLAEYTDQGYYKVLLSYKLEEKIKEKLQCSVADKSNK